MKKIFVVVLVILSMTMLTGCKNETLEESKNKKTNTELNEKVSDISIKDSKIFEGLDILNDNTLETKLGINRNFVSEHAIGMNLYTYEPRLYIVVKPKEENKEIVKKALDLYIDRAKGEALEEDKSKFENVLKEEYNGYYIYIVSDDNESVYNQIKGYLK